MNQPAVFIGLDVGAKRIGVARGNDLAKLASPLKIIEVDNQEIEAIGRVVKDERAHSLVVGLPRGLDGQETQQTKTVRQFADKLKSLGLPIHFQDEAGTSKQASRESMKSNGANGRVDDKAAAIILQDFLDNL